MGAGVTWGWLALQKLIGAGAWLFGGLRRGEPWGRQHVGQPMQYRSANQVLESLLVELQLGTEGENVIAAAKDIKRHIAEVRAALHRCSVALEPFDPKIQKILSLSTKGDYAFIIDSYYLFEDTELAKDHVREHGVSKSGERGEVGLAYLKFYGVMNACYMQHEAAIVCARKLDLEINKKSLSENELIAYRHDFAAHSPNRGRGEESHSFILDRSGLGEGRVAGYSSNAPQGITFRDARLQDLLAEWDSTLLPVIKVISDEIVSRIKAAGILEI